MIGLLLLQGLGMVAIATTIACIITLFLMEGTDIKFREVFPWVFSIEGGIAFIVWGYNISKIG